MSLNGTITALITPFRNDHLDEEGLARNIQDQIEAGVNGIFVLGTTGESHALSADEQKRVIEIAVKSAKGKVGVFVGTGCSSTTATIENSQQAQHLGADALIVVTPYYNKPSQEGLFRHFEKLSQNVSIPIYPYNNPGRTGVNLELQTVLRLAELPHLLGLKDSSANLLQLSEHLHALQKKHPHFQISCGDDPLILPMMALGVQGVISVISNLVPRQVVALVQHASKGDHEQARQMHYALTRLYKLAFVEVNPVPIKAAMDMCGRAAGNCRLPLANLLPENRQKLLDLLTEMQLVKG